MKYYKDEIKQYLENKGIQYRILEHPAVYTMAEMEQLGIFREGRVCKNLFLRDQKGKQHFLVSLPEEKQVDLKDLGEKLGGQRLSFASEERLQLGCHARRGLPTRYSERRNAFGHRRSGP